MRSSTTSKAAPELSIVAPAHNEQDNLEELVREVSEAATKMGLSYEFIVVDDASTDATLAVLSNLMSHHPYLRAIQLGPSSLGLGNGQSAAFHAGFRAARGKLIATLDADLQNNPADLPSLLLAMREHAADVVQGDRRRSRADGMIRSFSSWIGRLFRRRLLRDTIVDTGCSLRIMTREVALKLPLEFRGMHRFIPITARQLGYSIIEVPVSHRPRKSGRPKYGMWNRAIPGLIDCFAVRWMRNRRRSTTFVEVERYNNPSDPAETTGAREVVTP